MQTVAVKHFDQRVQGILAQIETGCRHIFMHMLTGVYVHGSLTFGCFLWEKSDIDIMIVTQDEPTQAQKERLITLLLALDADAPSKGLEMSLVLEENCRSFVYPTPFSLHFSNMHKQACKDDLRGYCARMRGTDIDLAAHFTVIRQAGIALCGKPVETVFSDVPREAFFDSIRYDIQDAVSDIAREPVYYTLNLCRALAYVQDGLVLSKSHGADWAFARLPVKYAMLVKAAQTCYQDANMVDFAFDLDTLTAFAQDMLIRIFGAL